MTSLSSQVIISLKQGEMSSGFPDALLNTKKNKVRKFDEGIYWDYKEFFDISSSLKLCEMAKDIVAFHNSEGGALIFGVNDRYVAKGLQEHEFEQSEFLRSKVESYFSAPIPIFFGRVPIANSKTILVLFVKKNENDLVTISRNGAEKKPGKPIFAKGDLFYRFSDQTKRVLDEVDRQRISSQLSYSNIEAYSLDLDDPFFRLLSPNYDRFFGREELIGKVKESLNLRHPVVALDGQGGVGKTALAIRAVREIHDEYRLDFIISVSAKSKVWIGKSAPVKSSFSGLRGLLEIIAQSLQIEVSEDTESLQRDVIQLMSGASGLILVDNAEDIEDSEVFHFLSQKVPDPVKVLITTRIDKGYGGFVISVPEMDDNSSHALLMHELQRSGHGEIEEDSHLKLILDETGNVPLAIKWAAMVITKHGSASEAAKEIASAGVNKTEFLSFCFENMFSSLSATAQSCAMLIPFLGESWSSHTLQIALDLELDEIRCSVHDISDAGLISQADRNGDFKYHVLPLAKQFLTGKLKRHASVEASARDRIFDAFSSAEAGLFDEWADESMAVFSLQCAREKLKLGDYRKAVQLSQLSRSVRASPEAMFIEGYCKFKDGRALPGLALIKRAFSDDDFASNALIPDACGYLEAVFASGSVYDQNIAVDCSVSHYVERILKLGGFLPPIMHNLVSRNRNNEIVGILRQLKSPADFELVADFVVGQRQNFRIWNIDKKLSDEVKRGVEDVRGAGVMSAKVKVEYRE